LICILFSSWQTLFDIKKKYAWDVTLKNSYDPTFSNFTKEKIKNINILRECKKIKK